MTRNLIWDLRFGKFSINPKVYLATFRQYTLGDLRFDNQDQPNWVLLQNIWQTTKFEIWDLGIFSTMPKVGLGTFRQHTPGDLRFKNQDQSIWLLLHNIWQETLFEIWDLRFRNSSNIPKVGLATFRQYTSGYLRFENQY